MTGELIESEEEDSDENTTEVELINVSINEKIGVETINPQPKSKGMMGAFQGGIMKTFESVVDTVLNKQEESLQNLKERQIIKKKRLNIFMHCCICFGCQLVLVLMLF